MHRSFALLVCLVVAAACTNAGPAPARDVWKTDTALVTATARPDVLDPQQSSFDNETSIIGMLYEPLLTWDPVSLALVPAAARALPAVSADGRTYTYTLRPGLTYSDGSPLEARRFVDAFTRLCDPAVTAEYAFVAFAIVGCQRWYSMDTKRASAEELEAGRAALGVRAADALTIEFTLIAPSATFPQATAMWIGSPVRLEDLETFESGWPLRRLARFIGNGPFVLAEWDKADRIVFERNERYRLPVRLARWTKRFLTDPDMVRVLYDAGRIDIAAVAPRDQTDRDALAGRTDLARVLGRCTSYVGFNTQRPPFDDARVRLAFAKALDKGEYTTTVALTGRAAASLVTHATPGHAHDDRAQTFAPAEARRSLASSKYGAPVDGALGGVTLRFVYQDSPAVKAQVEWIVQQWWVNLGVRVIAEPNVGWGQLIKRPEAAPELYRLGWCADVPDGESWYAQFTSQSGFDRTNFRDPGYDALVASAAVERDPTLRQSMYEGASRMLSNAAPGAWLGWNETWWLVDPRVQGYELTPFDAEFGQLSLARIVGVKRD